MPFQVKQEILEEDFRAKTKPTRVGIVLEKPVQSAEISMLIIPIDKKN